MRAERAVEALLIARGFTIVARNVHVGRDELDIVARHGDLLVVCEVRSRSTRAFLDPIVTIDRAKQARIRRATARFLSEQRLGVPEVRFDAASVVFDGPVPDITYYEAAF